MAGSRAEASLVLAALIACGTPHVAEVGTTPILETPTAPLPDAVPPEGEPRVAGFATGEGVALDDAIDGVTGSALAVRWLDGAADLGWSIAGLLPGPRIARVHALPCALGAGPPYAPDPRVPDAPLEVAAEVGPDGVSVGWLALPDGLRGDAASVVLSAPAGGGEVCADLATHRIVGARSEGELRPLAADVVSGAASLVRGSATTVSLEVEGLDPAADHVAWVHALPCAWADLDARYLPDPAVDEGVEAPVTVDPDGRGAATIRVEGHAARDAAQAVVLAEGAGPRPRLVACADLVPAGALPLEGEGEWPAGAGGPTGVAALLRRLDGVTVLSVALAELPPGELPVQLLDRPCALAGAPYRVAPDGEPVEKNGLWAPVRADASGQAARAVGLPHVARAEAAAVRILDPEGAPLACADLR